MMTRKQSETRQDTLVFLLSAFWYILESIKTMANVIQNAATAIAKSIVWVPSPVARLSKGSGATRNFAARQALASALFREGLTFLGTVGLDAARALLEGKGVTMPNGTIRNTVPACNFCGSYNGKQKNDPSRLALTAVFHSGKDPKSADAKFYFISAGSKDSCLARYILGAGAGKVVNYDALKTAYGK